MLVLFCLLCLIIALAFIFFIKGENFAQKILTPIGLFILFHSFIFFVMPMLQELYGISRFPSYLVSNTDSYSMFLSVGSAFLYLIICTITVFILGKSGLDYSVLSSASLVSNDNTKLVKVVCIVFIAVGSFVMFGVVAQYVNQFAYFMYNRINLLSGYGYFIKMLVFSLPLSVLLVCEFVRQNKKNSLLLLIITFSLVFIISLLLGSRAQALFMLPYVLITYILSLKLKLTIDL
ncbi:hypothetical protein [Pseudoalteromonas sp. R3]|uniref:hypothetical protein n=1 Tax=Pseudoalteromonas sp. R3 TaxID=1709477 RepID=UPI000FDD0D8F|nr:hypothetical protein [Pseudoalteromonas sp. R3]AZZ99573.1 hypothetical protein ELR70_22395 [Pseudoalteromonas sp. R3]